MTPTIHDRSRTLFADGYRCELSGTALLVTRPDGRATYRVTRGGDCNCPASTICKHSLGRCALAVAQADALSWEACALECEIRAAHTVWDRGSRLTETGLDLCRQVRELERAALALRMWAETQAVERLAVAA